MNWRVREMDKMVQALQRRSCLVDQSASYWMVQGDPQNAFVLAGTNDENDITLVPKDERTVAHDEGTRPMAAGFVRSGGESDDGRTPAEHVVCINRSQEDGRSASANRKLLRNVLPSILLRRMGKLLCRCQGLSCEKRNQGCRYLDSVPVVFPSEDGYEYTRDVLRRLLGPFGELLDRTIDAPKDIWGHGRLEERFELVVSEGAF